jgi:hypothetical protein
MSDQLSNVSNITVNEGNNNVTPNIIDSKTIFNSSVISEKTGDNGDIIITYDNCGYIYDTLAILSTIQEQDKLTVSINQTTKQPIFGVDKPYMWISVWRYWYGINRIMTIGYIEEFIDKYLCVAVNNILSVISSIKTEFIANIRNLKDQRDSRNITSKSCKKQCRDASEAVKNKLTPYNNVLNELIINIRNGAEGIKRLNITYSTDITMVEKLTNIYNKLYSVADNCDKARVSGISLE